MNKKKIIAVSSLAFVLVAGAATYCWAYFDHVEKTDNAFIKADSIVISPKVSGYVTQVSVADNARVDAGQVLVRIDADDYQAKVDLQAAAAQSRQAGLLILGREKAFQQSQIAQAEAVLDAAKAQSAKSALDAQRDMQLLAKGYATKDQAESSRLASELAATGIARARAGLAAAHDQMAVLEARETQMKADLRQSAASSKSVELDLAHATLAAPASGMVGNKTVEVGQFVRAGTQLMTIVPSEQVYVIANFKETQLRAMRIGQSASISVDAFPDHRLHGVISSISPATGSEFSLLPPENAVGNFTKIVQRVPVKIALSRAELAAQPIRPGMSVAVAVDTDSAPAATKVAQAKLAVAGQ